MGHRIKRHAALAAAGTAAVAAAVAGLALPAGAAPTVPAATSGTEHFQIVSTSATSPKASGIAWGVFTAGGTFLTTNTSASTETDTFIFPKGDFKVTHPNPTTEPTLSKSCLYQEKFKGTFKLSGGTGAYKGISGKGTFTLAVLGITPKTKTGACNANANPTTIQEIITATGTVKLP
jgi:hypothetical protein